MMLRLTAKPGLACTKFVTSNSERTKRAIVLPAANSIASQKIIGEALGRGFKVFAFTGDAKKAETVFLGHRNLNLIELSDHGAYERPGELSDRLSRAVGRESFDEFGVVSVLGGTTSTVGRPDSKSVLFKKNVMGPKNFVSASLDVASDCAEKTSVVNISSIAVSIGAEGCDYSKCRRLGEEAVDEISNKHGVDFITHLRISIAQCSPHLDPDTNELVVDSGHNHSAENWAGRRIIFVGGKDDTPLLQPVSMDCIAKGTLNAVARDSGPEHWRVNAVSKQRMTQREYLTYFTRDKSVLCVHVPLNVLSSVVQITSDGRFQPYAIHILKALEENPELLDTTEFEKLLGEPAETMDEIYSCLRKKGFAHEGIRPFRYGYRFSKSSLANPQDAISFIQAAVSNLRWSCSFMEK